MSQLGASLLLTPDETRALRPGPCCLHTIDCICISLRELPSSIPVFLGDTHSSSRSRVLRIASICTDFFCAVTAHICGCWRQNPSRLTEAVQRYALVVLTRPGYFQKWLFNPKSSGVTTMVCKYSLVTVLFFGEARHRSPGCRRSKSHRRRTMEAGVEKSDK